MKLLSIIGARPQFIKSAAVSRALSKNKELSETIVHTGQHYDKNMSDDFFKELNIPKPSYNLGVGSGSHGKQTALMLCRLEEVLVKEKPDWVIVYGDTNSTIAGALASTKLGIRIAHVEAGLRSFNRLMPEEINRITTDHISDTLFAPTLNAMNLLKKEGLADKSQFSGDVMYDSVIYYSTLIQKDISGYLPPNIPREFYLSTIHRPQNTDFKENLAEIFSAFAELDYPVILPLHPRTAKLLREYEINPVNVHIIEPVGYKNVLAMAMNSKKILTDSGGLQKEAYFLGKQCVTLRTETEWIETLHDNWNIISDCRKESILQAASAPLKNKSRNLSFGSGKASEFIANFFVNNP
ncbi:MAG: UDP-N-acetylglucosamine 2-epimerase (non-hydrolyzing) [Candidatus Cloacimonetes bacterium]|nr:UDP-N-acetylglucosamine 2-epimerase (non-hydrolyzing) [Candidatus Cloacimonadota bacterium]